MTTKLERLRPEEVDAGSDFLLMNRLRALGDLLLGLEGLGDFRLRH